MNYCSHLDTTNTLWLQQRLTVNQCGLALKGEEGRLEGFSVKKKKKGLQSRDEFIWSWDTKPTFLLHPSMWVSHAMWLCKFSRRVWGEYFSILLGLFASCREEWSSIDLWDWTMSKLRPKERVKAIINWVWTSVQNDRQLSSCWAYCEAVERPNPVRSENRVSQPRWLLEAQCWCLLVHSQDGGCFVTFRALLYALGSKYSIGVAYQGFGRWNYFGWSLFPSPIERGCMSTSSGGIVKLDRYHSSL